MEWSEESLITTYYKCSGLNGLTDIPELVTTMRAIGGDFVVYGKHESHPNPEADLEKGEFLRRIEIAHPCLHHDTPRSPHPWGTASLTTGIGESAFFIAQNIAYNADAAAIDAIAHGQLHLARLLYPFLAPAYGFIDIDGRYTPTNESVLQRKIKTLLWANFFGPPYVEQYGQVFLLNAPGWQTEVLPEGGVLYLISPNFTEKEQVVSMKKMLSYFRKVSPRIKAYRPTPRPGWEDFD